MRLTVPALLAAALLTAAVPAFAQEKTDKPATKAPAPAKATLSAGDAAPALSITKWLKGAPVTSFEKGHVYVVEFWATWCGPCIASMPHLSAIQKEFKDKVTIIGVSTEDSRNTLEKAEKMVAAKGDTMGYTVAWDNGHATNDAFMGAANQHFIPCAFVVDKEGKIAYFGSPEPLDSVLKQVLDGTWDAKAFDQISKLPEDDASAAVKKLDEIAVKSPKMAPLLAMNYNAIAWSIVDPQANVKNPDLATAMKAAEQAVKLSDSKDGAILDTLARVYWVKGDKAKATETETKAVAVAPEAEKPALQKTLDEYKSSK